MFVTSESEEITCEKNSGLDELRLDSLKCRAVDRMGDLVKVLRSCNGRRRDRRKRRLASNMRRRSSATLPSFWLETMEQRNVDGFTMTLESVGPCSAAPPWHRDRHRAQHWHAVEFDGPVQRSPQGSWNMEGRPLHL